MFEFLCLLPPYLQPSFTQNYIENQREAKISNALMPEFDYGDFKFSDLKKVKDRQSIALKEFIA